MEAKQTNKTELYIYIYIYINYVPNQLVKILQTVSPRLALQHVRVFPDMYSYSILPRKCPRTSLSLTNMQIKVKH